MRRSTIEFVLETTAAVSIIVSSLLIFTVPPVGGYENTLYVGIPISLWVFVAVAGCSSLCIVYLNNRGSRNWLIGVVLLVTTYIIFFMFPLIRGYPMYTHPVGDHWFHLANIDRILHNGRVHEDLFYPATHLLFASIKIVSTNSYRVIHTIITITFFVVYLLGFYTLGKQYFKNSHAGASCLVAATPLLFSDIQLVVVPWIYGFLLSTTGLSLIIALEREKVNIIDTFGILIVPIAILFFHVISSFFFTAMVIVHDLSNNRVLKQKLLGSFSPVHKFSVAVGVTIAGGFITWHLSFARIQLSILRSIGPLLNVTPGVASYASQAANTNFTLAQLFWQFVVFRWGPTLLYGIMGCFIATRTIISFLYSREVDYESKIELVAQFIIGGGFMLVFFSFDIILQNMVRISQYAIFFSIPLVGSALWKARRKPQISNSSIRGILFAIVIVTGLLAGSIAYDREVITESEISGSEWLIEHESDEITTRSLLLSYRLEVYLEGVNVPLSQPAHERTFSEHHDERDLPRRLGYDTSGSIGTVIENDTYLVTKERDIRKYESAPENRKSEIRYYSREDLKSLYNDSTADGLIYDNGEFKTWLVTANSSST